MSERCHEAMGLEELIWTEGGGDPGLSAAGASTCPSTPQASVEWVVPRCPYLMDTVDSKLGHFPKSIWSDQSLTPQLP